MSKREVFEANLRSHPYVVNFANETKLRQGFEPRRVIQETCLVNLMTEPNPARLRCLDHALERVLPLPGFRGKVQRLSQLTCESGAEEFNSLWLELYYAALFVDYGMKVTYEPVTVGSKKAEFNVEIGGKNVYIEVRNLESAGWATIGEFDADRWPRSRIEWLDRLLRDAYASLPYPYMVEYQPVNLSGQEEIIAGDVASLLVELGCVLKQLAEGKRSLEMPLDLPRDRPRIRVTRIDRKAGLRYAWLGYTEASVEPVAKLADAARFKISEKGEQLSPDAPNVIIVGLPCWVDAVEFAQQLVGSLADIDGVRLVASEGKMNQLGSVVQKRASVFVFVCPDDQGIRCLGQPVVILNPVADYRCPDVVVDVLRSASRSTFAPE